MNLHINAEKNAGVLTVNSENDKCVKSNFCHRKM